VPTLNNGTGRTHEHVRDLHETPIQLPASRSACSGSFRIDATLPLAGLEPVCSSVNPADMESSRRSVIARW
jgi:hypothetical protein